MIERRPFDELPSEDAIGTFLAERLQSSSMTPP
jgi:hypothetical protein